MGKITGNAHIEKKQMRKWAQVFIMTILYLSILYIDIRHTAHILEAMELNVEFVSADDAFTTVYELLDKVIGVSSFNQTVPLLISGVAVGVCLVNRNFPKCLGHLIGAIFVSLISMVLIAFSGNLDCKQFTTAFLWYTIAYLVFCIQASKRVDANTLIGIVVSLIILVFIDAIVFLGGLCSAMGSKTYIGMLLMGLIGGIGGFYATKSIIGKAGLYDFSGCSCDDCDGKSKCSVGSKTRTVLAKQMVNPSNSS